MADLRLTFGDVYDKVLDFLGTDPTASDTLIQAKDCVYSGYRNFLYATNPSTNSIHTWSWLIKDYIIRFSSGVWKYPLPADFGRAYSGIVYLSNNQYPEMVKTSSGRIHAMRTYVTSTSQPTMFAVSPDVYDVSTGQSKELMVFPTPGGTYDVLLQYVVNPSKPTLSTDYFIGDAGVSEAILQCSLAVAEQQIDEKAGIQTQLAAQVVQRMINADKPAGADTVGFVVDGNVVGLSPATLKEITRKSGTYNDI